MLGPANLLSFCFMELIVWGNNRYWFNSMIWVFMKARISLRTNFCSIPGMTVLDERVLSTHSKKAWWHRHTLPSSTEAHAKLVVSSLTNFRNFRTFLSDAASPLRLLALLAWAPPPCKTWCYMLKSIRVSIQWRQRRFNLKLPCSVLVNTDLCRQFLESTSWTVFGANNKATPSNFHLSKTASARAVLVHASTSMPVIKSLEAP